MSTITPPTQAGPQSPDDGYQGAVKLFMQLMEAAPRYSIPPYDYWEPLTMGGLTGKYTLLAPFDTSCEYRILQLASTDVASAYIGKYPTYKAPSNTSNIGGDPTNFTSTPDRGVAGVVLTAAANTTTPGPDEWLPFGANDQLYIDLNVATSHAAWVGVLFRRRRQISGVWLEGA